VIIRDPYGISGAVAPWRSLDAMEPIVERNITERDAEEAAICGQCPLPDCNPQRVGCLLHTRAKKPKPSRDLLERMALDGYGPETIAKATGYAVSTTAGYMQQFFRDGPCVRCSTKNICDAAGGTCSRKERWKAVKEDPNDGR
jgi:hypothetical protein